MEVAANAQRVCGEMLEVSWIVCNTSVASGTAPVDLQLPVATAVVVQIQRGQDDVAGRYRIAASDLGVDHERAEVSVTFDDGKTRDFTRDDRVCGGGWHVGEVRRVRGAVDAGGASGR